MVLISRFLKGHFYGSEHLKKLDQFCMWYGEIDASVRNVIDATKISEKLHPHTVMNITVIFLGLFLKAATGDVL